MYTPDILKTVGLNY